MSKRRTPGEWIILEPSRLWSTPYMRRRGVRKAEIVPALRGGDLRGQLPAFDPCENNCGDLDCRRWPVLLSKPEPDCGGRRIPIYRVAECEMADAVTEWGDCG